MLKPDLGIPRIALACAFAAVSSLLALSEVDAAIISVNIADNNRNNAMEADDLAGANPAVRVGNWNNIDGNDGTISSGLTFDDDTAIGGTFSVTEAMPNSFAGGTGLSNDALMLSVGNNVGPFTSPASGSVTFNDIPFATYDVYVYARHAGSSPDRGGSVSVSAGGTDTFFIRGGSAANSDGTGYVLATATTHVGGENDGSIANYAFYSGLSDEDLTVSYDWETYAVSSSRGFTLYGIQIVESVIPEPASFSLLGVGCSLVFCRRRRSATA